jgi:two-component system, NarL family, invasion response regulator UvrY
MKVIIADDHPVVRQGLRQMLAVESDLDRRRGGAQRPGSGRLVARVPWEVAVLDYNMPGKNGLELIKELRQRYPGRAVLILSMYPEDRYAVRALKAGASGYLTKESAPEELVSAIRKVAERRPLRHAHAWARSSRSSSRTTAASRCTRRSPTASTRSCG